MISEIQGLHHVTSLASDAARNNLFFTEALGLRRVKKTVNFDAPEVYHLYYGDETGSPGSVMTYFPFQGMPSGRAGTGEVGLTAFVVPEGAIGFWQQRLDAQGVSQADPTTLFGEQRLTFIGPDNERFALVEQANPQGEGWTGNGVSGDAAIRHFHSTSLRLGERDADAMAELLGFMGYERVAEEGQTRRYRVASDMRNGADVIDVDVRDEMPSANQGSGSVHHVAFAVANKDVQSRVREKLMETGYQVTPQIDRDYFWAIYFRTPGGVLFEVATNEPGFDRDEDVAHLGEALKLPSQHAHLRGELEQHLQPLGN
ncbi:MAG: VOC family protein [Pseudomonadota bacterium]